MFWVNLGIDEIIQADLQIKVTNLIIKVLIANEGLHYYQVINSLKKYLKYWLIIASFCIL